MRGQGHHAVRVEMNVPVLTTVEGHRLDFAIPEAAKTSVELEIGSRVVDALAGDDQRVTVAPIADGKRSRLSAHLTPRSRIDLSWRIVADPGMQLAPLLSMQGNIAIDIDPGSFRTRSSWSISPIRGTTRTLELRLHPDDEVLEVEVDGQHLPAGIERAEGMTRLTIPLTEPLRTDPPTRLVMTTRRPLSSPRITFGGFPLTHAKDQSGAVGITPSANLWIDQSAGRALRRIDPRTELPDELRSRPEHRPGLPVLRSAVRAEPGRRTVSAVRLLGIQDDAPPRCGPGSPRHVGRLSVREGTPLRAESPHAPRPRAGVGRPRRCRRIVARRRRGGGKRGPGTSAEGSRVLTVRLTEKAREGGDFRLHLVGRQALDPSQPVSVALFQPDGTSTGGGRIAILTERDVTVDRPDSPEGESGDPFRPETNEPPSDWSWPADRTVARVARALAPLRWAPGPAPAPGHGPPGLGLPRDPGQCRGRASRHRDSARSRTSRVRFGTLGYIDVAVPTGARRALGTRERRRGRSEKTGG